MWGASERAMLVAGEGAMRGPLRVALVGHGFIGRVHARAIARTAGTELRGVLGRDGERARRFAAELRIPRVFARSVELAADPEIDAVVVATPNRDHYPLCAELLEAGKHVLVEKPMTVDAGEAERLRALAVRCGRRLMVGHMWRFDREARRLRSAIAGGAIGRVVRTKGYGIHAHWGPGGWFTDSARAGGGALIDMGVHAIDTVRFLLGDPAPVTVYARLGTHYGDYDVDDVGVLVVTWSQGTCSVIECGWWSPHTDGPEASTQLFGTRGYARLFPTELRRIVDGKTVTDPLHLPARSEHLDPHIFEGQMAEFAAAIRESRDASPGPDHGLAVLRVCDAAYRSAREGRAVDLEP